MSDLSDVVAQVGGDIDKAVAMIAALQGENANLKTQVDAQAAQIADVQAAIAALKAACVPLEAILTPPAG